MTEPREIPNPIQKVQAEITKNARATFLTPSEALSISDSPAEAAKIVVETQHIEIPTNISDFLP